MENKILTRDELLAAIKRERKAAKRVADRDAAIKGKRDEQARINARSR